jgi:drug/metabolite transporter (DMT)-like permease
MLLAGILLLPFCLGDLWRTWREGGLSGFLRLLVPGLILSAHFQCWVLGLRHTSVASATFIFSLNPVFFALVQRFGARRRLPAYALASLGLAVAGAVWLFLLGGGGWAERPGVDRQPVIWPTFWPRARAGVPTRLSPGPSFLGRLCGRTCSGRPAGGRAGALRP